MVKRYCMQRGIKVRCDKEKTVGFAIRSAYSPLVRNRVICLHLIAGKSRNFR